MGKLSATGANPSIPPMTIKNRDKHCGGGDRSDHSKDYPGISKHRYAARALKLARSATDDNILGYRAADGSIVRYNKFTNDFVKAYDTGVATMFKPKDCEGYFYRKMVLNGGTQND